MADTDEYRTTEDASELRIDRTEAEPLEERDPQADRRMAIAEALEKRREAEITAQWKESGLPPEDAPEPPRREEEPASESEAPALPEAQPDVRHSPVAATPSAAPQLFPMPLPNGGVTYVTAEQAAELARIGAATLSQQYQRPPQYAQQPQQHTAPAASPRPVLDRERAAVLAQRLSFGTTEEQADALIEYAAVVSPDVDKIKREVRDEERARQTLEQNLAIIGREYPEIFHDPVLTQVAAVQLSGLRGHPAAAQMSELDQYRVACNQVRQRFTGNSVQQQPEPQQSRSVGMSSERLTRKRNAPTALASADRRMVMQEAAPSDPTASEIIQEIRRARGQA